MATDHYMPLFVGDFLASTATWSGPERGLYVQLLMLQWGSKRLPTDLSRLARAAGYTRSEFDDLWPLIADKFQPIDGALVNIRLEQIRTRNSEVQAKRSAAGAAGADARWHSKGNAIANAIANGKGNGKGNGKIMPSDPIRSESGTVTKPNQSKTVQAASPPQWAEDFKSIYPPRAGDPNWRGAWRAASARIAEGHSPDEFLEGARRYANFCRGTGKANTETVQQASRFLGPGKPFMLLWALLASRAQTAQDSNVLVSQEWLERFNAATR